MTIATTNPATGTVVKRFDPTPDAEIDRRIGLAARDFEVLRRVRLRPAGELDERGRRPARRRAGRRSPRMMTTEMGKTLASAKAEVAKCASACRFYAEHAERFLADEPTPTPAAVNARRAYARLPAARRRCSRSCRGTSRSGRRCGSPRRR